MAAVGAALKKILVSLLTSKKGRKFLVYTVLVILLVIFMPILAVVAVLKSDFSFDHSSLSSVVVSNLTAEQQAQLQRMNDIGVDIGNAMKEAGFTARTKEAEVLFVLALSDHMDEDDFVSRLVGCFAEGQTDAQLVAAVNAEFGTEILVEDFSHVMQSIRAVYIDTSHYTDPSTKNNLDLVQYAIEAEKAGWGYVWGTYGLERVSKPNWSSIRMISASTKNSSGKTGSAFELQTVSASSRATAGSILTPMKSNTGQTVWKMWVRTGCTPLLKRKAPLIRYPKFPA